MVSIAFTVSGVLAIIVGLLILFLPKMTRILIGLYLIIVGILGLLGV